MKYIADLHIHSPFSRATSKASNLAGLVAWSAVKGIDVIGTGDFTHPGWFKELRENLQSAEPGFFKLVNTDIPKVIDTDVTEKAKSCRFVLTAEISSIYKKQGRVRKIHNVLFVPDFDSAARINARLASIGNIESDGRPILGLDAHDLLEIVLEMAPDGFLVPAHIWTPWFSLFGSKSGFDVLEDCFDDLSKYIFALETGLSSDPDMNRLVSALDRFTLISNSDCHSPGKLGREANIFTCGFNFFSMRDALKNPVVGGFQGTLEFFPEEGKYHHDGHRKCSINLPPQETRKMSGICPVCGKPLTIGVMHRVMELADREVPYYPPNSPRYYSLIPLPEVLSEIFSKGSQTKAVMQEYGKIIRMFDSEFNLLLNVSISEIHERYSPVLAEAIKRIRNSKVIRKAGYDGEFGVIKVFEQGELKKLIGQYSLFPSESVKKKCESLPKPSLLEFGTEKKEKNPKISTRSLNAEQLQTVVSEARYLVVTAGPGTGKTFTLISRIQRLLQENLARPQDIAAITFTNRAAEEMRERLSFLPEDDREGIFIGTFHAFCLQLLRDKREHLTVVADDLRDKIIRRLFHSISSEDLHQIKLDIESYYHKVAMEAGELGRPEAQPRVQAYLKELDKRHGIDLSGVIPEVVFALKIDRNFLQKIKANLKYLFIDEFQDLNRNQYELVRLLAKKCSVFAIGDPDQAIYGFRGSSPEYFHHFITDFKAENVALIRNYRSAPRILEAAAAVIAHNHDTATEHTALISENKTDAGNIEWFQAVSPQAEAEFIVQRIEQLMGGISHFSIDSGRSGDRDGSVERSFKDFAVLYRLSQQAEQLSEALERRGIPFQVVNIRPFFMQHEIRPLYYWIRVAAGYVHSRVETEVYLHLLQAFPGFGKTTLGLLENQLPLGDCHDFFEQVKEIKLPKTIQGILADIQQNLMIFRTEVEDKKLPDAMRAIMEFLRINPKTPEAERLLELAGSFGADLQEFSSYLKKNENATVYDEKAEAVTLVTMHGAKGLEFPVVFITGMEEGLFPLEQDLGKKDTDSTYFAGAADLKEERRLFYVGMTRAENQLILTSAETRPIFGAYRKRPVSSFMDEIPVSLYEKITRKKTKKKRSAAKQMKLF